MALHPSQIQTHWNRTNKTVTKELSLKQVREIHSCEKQSNGTEQELKLMQLLEPVISLNGYKGIF